MDVTPTIAKLQSPIRAIFNYRVLSVKGYGDSWLDDHIPCRQVEVTTERGTVVVSLWHCGDVAYLVDVAHESPTAMAAVLHTIHSEIIDAMIDEAAAD